MATSLEFRLALERCRLAFSGAGAAEQPDLGADIDWPAFVGLVRFHRVQGLVWRGLEPIAGKIPRQIRKQLSRDAEAIAAANLRAAVESRDLLTNFDRAGIPLLFIKGVTLGALAYDDIAIKSGVDIDLLITKDQLEAAAVLLRKRGYHLVIPALENSVGRLDAWHRLHKESVWVKGKIQIDLHTRLPDNPRLIPAIGIGSPQQLVEVSSGIRLPTLAPDELFAYLTVHGASSLWFRLKWITDLAALLQRSSPSDIERLYRRSQDLGAGRAPAQALLLAHAIFGTLSECAALREELEREPAGRWLYRSALNQLSDNNNATEPTSRLLGTAIIHLTQFALLPGPRFKLSELVRQARAALG